MLLRLAAMLVNTKSIRMFYYFLGFDLKANPVEILYNEFGDNCVNVFHAMHCQKKYYNLFEGGKML